MLHEHLETFNTPCYFLEFGRRAEPYRLAYLADANAQTMFAVNYGEKVSVPLLKECGHSQVLVEQYLDFVRQPHVPAIAAGARRTRTADQLQLGPQAVSAACISPHGCRLLAGRLRSITRTQEYR